MYTAGRSEISQHREEYVRYYLANRFSGFKNDQVLEMLLHFAFPQRNTALLSESLMERFGSLHGVLSAGVDLLMAVDGMTRHAAVLLDMVLQAAQRAIEEQNSVNDLLNTDEKVGEFLLRKFYGLTTEDHLSALSGQQLPSGQLYRAGAGQFQHRAGQRPQNL